MAAKSKKTKKSTSSSANQQTRAGAEYAKAQTRNATNSAYDFANFAKNFAPTQFFNLSSLQNSFQNYQPANLQQLAEQMIETSQKNLETVTACTQVWAEHTKGTLEEQANFAAKLMQEAASSLSEAFSTTSSDPREKFEEISELTKNYFEKTTKQARKAAEENIEIANKIGKVLTDRATATVEELRNAA